MATVLVVDDERPILEMLIEIVEDAGHTALHAYDGTQALQLAQRYRPDLIISDVMMPKLDGYGLLAAVRGDPAIASTSMILMSALFSKHSTPNVPGTTLFAKPLDLVSLEQVLAGLP